MASKSKGNNHTSFKAFCREILYELIETILVFLLPFLAGLYYLFGADIKQAVYRENKNSSS